MYAFARFCGLSVGRRCFLLGLFLLFLAPWAVVLVVVLDKTSRYSDDPSSDNELSRPISSIVFISAIVSANTYAKDFGTAHPSPAVSMLQLFRLVTLLMTLCGGVAAFLDQVFFDADEIMFASNCVTLGYVLVYTAVTVYVSQRADDSRLNDLEVPASEWVNHTLTETPSDSNSASSYSELTPSSNQIRTH